MEKANRLYSRRLLLTSLGVIVALFVISLFGTEVHAESGKCSISITQSGNRVTVKGTANEGYRFNGLIVDNNVESPESGTSIYYTIDMNKYDTGYHTVVVGLWDTTANCFDSIAAEKKYVKVNKMTARPSDVGSFTVYQKYFDYYPYVNFGNTSGHLYLELSTNKKNWTRWDLNQYNYITTASSIVSRISGLKPNKKYYTRIRYGEYINYDTDIGGDGKAHFFGGPVLKTKTIKTGKKTKPPVKSVTAKAVNVKFHKKTRPGYYYWTGYHYVWIKAVKMRYYTYNVKVTVRLKKKPGTNGIWVDYNGMKRYLKGNKKKYTTTFKIPSPYNMTVKKPRGNIRGTVVLQTGQSKSYGGYSPKWKKTMKLK